MYPMTLIRFKEQVKDERTGQYVEQERIEVAGVNLLMKLLYNCTPYEVVKEFI